jgi:serine phosphatase RsbU (regulator of sigma subunit)
MVYQLQLDTNLTECSSQLLSALTYSKLDSDNVIVDKALRRARHAEHDLRAAQEVQSWLFPHHCPAVPGLAYAGACRQARQLGGDFYDFIAHGGGRLGIVVGDIAGKGIAAALSMATLRTLLHSQYAAKADSLPQLLTSVNRLFHDSTPAATYSTLFLADYDDKTRRLRYVNCGHPAPLLIHSDGTIDRLSSTAFAIGLFPEWCCAEGETFLQPCDMLAIHTDGLSEAMNESEDEYGVDRMLHHLLACASLSAYDAASSTLEQALAFGGEQQDDMTLVVARVLGY